LFVHQPENIAGNCIQLESIFCIGKLLTVTIKSKPIQKETGICSECMKTFFAPDKIHVPYFKTFYKAKPTKRFIKLMNQAKQLKGVSLEQMVHM
jgi:hypothetical protein